MQAQKRLERRTVESNDELEPNDGVEPNDGLEPTGDVERMPTALDSPRTKLVYLYLTTVESGTVEEVRDALGIELISLYPVIDSLREKDLVRKDGSRYVCSTA